MEEINETNHQAEYCLPNLVWEVLLSIMNVRIISTEDDFVLDVSVFKIQV